MTRRLIIRLAAVVVVLNGAAALRPAPVAHAGAYHVRSCFADGIAGIWQRSRNTTLADAYNECPEGPNGNHGLYARNVLSSTPAPGFGAAKLYVDTPPGTYIDDIQFDANIMKSRDWQAGLWDAQNSRWLWCGVACTTSFIWTSQHVGGFGTNSLAILIICGGYQCASDGKLVAFLRLRNVTLRLQDVWNPWVAIVGGSLATGGWKRGVQTVEVEGQDNTGVRTLRALVDGAVHDAKDVGCDDHQLVPCPPTRRGALQVDLSKLSDGAHRMEAHALDSSGNTTSVARTVLVDNTAPNPVRDLAVTGTEWQPTNTFGVSWKNPADDGKAPIAGAVYQLCPEASSLPTICQHVQRAAGSAITQLTDVTVPSPGAWRLRLWLVDEAGNQSEQTAREVALRWDPDPPSVKLRDRDENDPARITVDASDSVSGIATTEVELRRQGDTAWYSLPVERTARGFTSVVDDEALPEGAYAIRARASDRAGNEESTEGQPVSISLPVRLTTELLVGKMKLVRAGSHGRRRILIVKPRTTYGKTIKLTGRLTSPGKNPLGGRDVDISEWRYTPGSSWSPVATVRTDRQGRFTFRALPGPNRLLRFRYPGTPTIRGQTSLVEMRVRASTRISVDRNHVVNGEDVLFRGRIRGGPIPPPGKLLQLQVYSRGAWLTFATPRANMRGRWRHRYRFTATRGTTRYRFRARLPREAGFPYEPGVSRAVWVTVRGL